MATPKEIRNALSSANPLWGDHVRRYGDTSPVYRVLGQLCVVLDAETIEFVDLNIEGASSLSTFSMDLHVFTKELLICVSSEAGSTPVSTAIPRRHMNSLIIDQADGVITSDVDFVPGELDVTVAYEGRTFKLPSGQNTDEATKRLLAFLPSLIEDRKKSVMP